jgi:voltage-dependent potassium channel beta subunit
LKRWIRKKKKPITKMEYRRLGKTGLQISEMSFGSWITFGTQIGKDLAQELMVSAYDNGVNFFDNAEVYAGGKSEILMGQVLKDVNWSRDSYLVSSKAFFGIHGLKDSRPTQMGNTRKHLSEACHQALQRLQVDYLDLYYCHRPDKNTPIEETVWAMHNLILQGKILYWGTSEWSAQEIMEAHMVAKQYHLIGPSMEQPQYNMIIRDKVEVEYSQIYKTLGLGTTVWSPLASGILTGKYNNGVPEGTRLNLSELGWLAKKNLQEDYFTKVRNLSAFADELGISMPQLAIAWVLKNENVSTAILGASKTSQLEENLKAGEAKKLLTREVMEKIEAILNNAPLHPDF